MIVFLAGAALIALHLSASIVLSQSYGDNALVWSDLTGIFFVSIAVGLLIGTPLANKFRGPELLFGLSLISGILVFLLPWIAPRLQNLLLTKNMGPYASSMLFSAALVLPASILLATVAPAAWKVRSIIKSGQKTKSKKNSNPAAREANALKWFLFTLSLGAVCGSFTTLVVLPIVGHWGFLNAIAILLVVIAFLGLSLHIKFLVTAVVVIHFCLASAIYEELIPVEAQLRASEYAFDEATEKESDDFRKKRFLTYAEVRKTFGAMRAKIVEATDKSIGIKLVADSLEGLGNVAISGSDFEKVYCELITDPDVLAQTTPFVKRIRLIESDGFGRIYFQIRRIKGSAQATLVIPQKSGFIKLLFKSHFTLTISRKSDTQTNIAIGPVNIVEGGLFSSSKSYYTPVTAVDAVGPFDVTLVFLDIHNEADRVRITVSGQGFIGGLKTKEIANLEK